jgi:hypothetical protein
MPEKTGTVTLWRTNSMENSVGREVAEGLLARLRDGNVRPDDIAEVVTDIAGRPVNCYPGVATGRCFEDAFVVSLRAGRYRKKGRTIPYLPYNEVFSCIRAQLRDCQNTRTLTIISDSWDVRTADKFQDVFDELKNRGVRVEAFLYVGGWFVPLPI